MFAQHKGLAARWRQDADRYRPDECWQRCVASGISVVTPADHSFPAQLLGDPACPAALFVRGDLDALDARRVGIVGTRNATQRGRQTAAEFGSELAAAGVVVVSGLARGIDGAAHRGALECARGAARSASSATGSIARTRPSMRNCGSRSPTRGALISEWPPGTPPDPFRFPLRNRILAALVEVLVVVESRERGGSLITAKEAADRSVEVLAVPGLGAQPCIRGHEPAPRRRRDHRDRTGRCPDGAGTRPPSSGPIPVRSPAGTAWSGRRHLAGVPRRAPNARSRPAAHRAADRARSP